MTGSYKTFSSNKLIFCIALIVISDMLTCLAFNLQWSYYNFGILIKSPLELVFIYLIIREKRAAIFLKIILALVAIWMAGILTTYLITGGSINYKAAGEFVDSEITNSAFSASFVVLNRYLLFFLLFPVMLLYKDDEEFIKNCKLIFECFLWINSLMIIFGFIFNLNIFESYNPREYTDDPDAIPRFGYKGLILGINEITGVYFLGLAYVYREVFAYKNKNKIILLLLVIISAVLTGTKGCVLSILLLTILYFAKYKKRTFLIVVVPLVLYGIYFLWSIDIIDTLSDLLNVTVIDNYTTTPAGMLLTFLTSGRNIFIMLNWGYMLHHWGIFNYIFGDGILYSETDFMDLYYFFGLGGFIYLYYYTKLILQSEKLADIKYIFLFIMIIAFTGGHFIRSAIVPYFLCLYLITSSGKMIGHSIAKISGE